MWIQKVIVPAKRQYARILTALKQKEVFTQAIAGGFLIKSIGAGVVFLLNVMLARFLGAEQYGVYIFVWSWIAILGLFSSLGFRSSLVRFIPEYQVKQEWGLLRGIIKQSQKISFSISVSVAILGSFIIWSLGNKLQGNMAITFYVAFGFLPTFTFLYLQLAPMTGFKKTTQVQFLLNIFQPLLVGVLVLGLFVLMKERLRAPMVMAANLLSIFITALIGKAFLSRLLSENVEKKEPEFSSTEWLKVSFPLLIVTVMFMILRKTDIIMLGILMGSAKTGIYAAASNISDLLGLLPVSVNVVLAPVISELYHSGQKQEMQKMILLASRIIFIFSVVISLLLIISGKFILSLFGGLFIEGYSPFLILLCGQVLNSFMGPVAVIMAMSGKQATMGVILALSVVFNIFLNSSLIPVLGQVGAAISTALTMILWNLLMFLYVRRTLGINSTVFSL